ncbi:MAG: type III-A CRISPR-associated protein Cas10/Csm1 [Candidatus Methanoperedens sp.]|nr:MAG: type III-A CRISPR-associated protein Cas10/Csm1 [Candidatus Methanoperedens sp.]
MNNGMGDNKDYEKLMLAAVVHDVGKFWQGTGEKRTHQELGAKFLRKHIPEQWQDAAGIISMHHETGKLGSGGYELLKILMVSDWLSSGERDDRDEDDLGKRINEPLISIFSEINLGIDQQNNKWRIPLTTLSLDENSLFPKIEDGKVDLKSDYRNLWNKFIGEVDTIKGISDFNKYFNSLYYILQKYAWCIPSAVYKNTPDISLFDHLKTTCAISACLYKFHDSINQWDGKSINDRNTQKFLLIGGDISGIQKYIYDIASVGVGGVAKRLRARSFYISMISEVVPQRLLDGLNLPSVCNIISSGGRFFIIAPNTEATRDKFINIKKNVSEWLLNEFQGNLSLNLEYIEFSGKGLEIEKSGDDLGFSRVFDRISDKLDSAKLHKFNENLVSENKWNDSFLSDIEINNVCKSCVKIPVNENQELCKKCEFDAKIGNSLLDAKYIAFSKIKPKHQDCLSFFSDVPYYVSVRNKLDDSDYYLILRLNNLDLDRKADGFKIIANYVYQLKDRNTQCATCQKIDDCSLIQEGSFPKTASFDCVVRLSEGKSLLGILKADVDNLGLIFSMGLKKNNKDDSDRDTISRVTMLSRMLDLFFTGWIHHVVETLYPHCYIVYSGGDDLLIAGPWNEIIELSKKINQDFRSYTCNNQNITLSAGIFLSKSKFPIARSSNLADEELEKSKKGDKNQITLFNKTVQWQKFSELIDYGNFLDAELKKNKNGESPINSSFVNRLLKYCRMAEEGDIMYLSRIKYDIGRNIINKNMGTNENEIIRRLLKMRDEMSDMIIPVSYALYKNREEKK